MRKILIIFVGLFILAGCAGTYIKPITADRAQEAHTTGTDDKGYIVYSPVVIIEIKEDTICLKQDTAGKCSEYEIVCKISEKPILLPDYSKPFLIRPQAGFGKADVEISIVDGWQLGKVTDKSDNTAVLDSVIKAVKEVTTLTKGVSKAAGCPKAGLYKLEYSKGNLQLEPLLIYYKEENKK